MSPRETFSYSGVGESSINDTYHDPSHSPQSCGNLTVAGQDPSDFVNDLNVHEWLEQELNSATDDGEFQHLTRSQLGFDSHTNIYSSQIPNPSATHCPYSHDGILCWPPTPVGQIASLSCMEKLHGITYNTSGTVTRVCDFGGVWNRTNFSSCEHMMSVLNGSDVSEPLSLDTTITIYFCGYGLSLGALICAAIIFIAFKELRCLRNTIHSHLIITYILHDILWLVSIMTSGYYKTGKHGDRAVCVTFIMLHYLYLTNFFWMLVEGLYLYVLVVQTFMAETIKLRTYVAIGWGIPLIIVQLWWIVRWISIDFGTPTTASVMNSMWDLDQNVLPCPWLHENVYDWIHKAPALLCLAANTLFLLQIMWVLITKLRSATTPETQQSRKAAKALVILMPLLGITYILILIGPKKVPEYEHVRAFLISTQGFLVALFYCFLNQEVRIALRHRWNRLRNMGPDCLCCGCDAEADQRQHMQQLRDWSPRSRTESIRLYTPTGHTYRKRESTTSDTTTVQSLAVLGSFNGSGAQNVIHTTTTPNSRRYSTPLHSCRPSNVAEDTAFI